MRILGLDTSTDAVSTAVLHDGRLEAQSCLMSGRKHSVTLLPMLQSMLDSAGLRMDDMDALCVTAGPGSFTGVRIGVATASAFAYALDLPVFEVSTLDALIALAPENMPVCALLDARRDQVYVKAQAGDDVVIDESAMSLGDVIRLLAAGDGWLFTGDGAAAHRDELQQAVPGAVFMPEAASWPAAAGACVCAASGAAEEKRHDTLRARYLRAPQAVREKAEKARAGR